jgi:hypothetical protein
MNQPIARHTLILFLLTCLGFGARAADLRVDLPERGSIVLAVPEDWTSHVTGAGAQLPLLVKLSPKAGKQFQVLMTLMPPASAGTPKPTLQMLRANMSRAATKAAERSEQKDLPLIDISGPGVFGTYFSATDREPEPSGYKYLTQGMIAIDDVLVGFTVLARDESASVVDAALRMLERVRRQR